MINAVHHLAIIISAEQHLDFYKLLGFHEAFRTIRPYDTVVLMEGHGMELEVFIDPSHAPRPDQEPLGLRHFALRVSEPLEIEMERLRRESPGAFDCGPIRHDWQGERFVFLKDPDGTVVELHE